jgi:hypothetical protein
LFWFWFWVGDKKWAMEEKPQKIFLHFSDYINSISNSASFTQISAHALGRHHVRAKEHGPPDKKNAGDPVCAFIC